MPRGRRSHVHRAVHLRRMGTGVRTPRMRRRPNTHRMFRVRRARRGRAAIRHRGARNPMAELSRAVRTRTQPRMCLIRRVNRGRRRARVANPETAARVRPAARARLVRKPHLTQQSRRPNGRNVPNAEGEGTETIRPRLTVAAFCCDSIFATTHPRTRALIWWRASRSTPCGRDRTPLYNGWAFAEAIGAQAWIVF